MSDDVNDWVTLWTNRVERRVVTFDVFAHAQVKQRPRHNTKTNNVYTPKKTADFEKLIANLWPKDEEPFTCPVHMEVHITQKMPKTMNKYLRVLAEERLVVPTVGDLDNKLKAVSDGLNGVAYIDDAQIASVTSTKFYGADNHISVSIYPIGLSDMQVNFAIENAKNAKFKIS